MANKTPFRHELKFKISYAEYLALRQRLRCVMKPDTHAGETGRYAIQSIYFDNCDDKALREKVNGYAKREKFRIRYYNQDFSVIHLEKKMKVNRLCQKISAPLTLEECKRILKGNTLWMLSHPSPLVRELYCKMKNQGLKPRVQVSYLREPFTYAPGNVRVTFDSKIRTSLYSGNFFDVPLRDIEATETSDDVILEVKYDAYLPDVIAKLIQTDGVRQTAYSKYATCRRFG